MISANRTYCNLLAAICLCFSAHVYAEPHHTTNILKSKPSSFRIDEHFPRQNWHATAEAHALTNYFEGAFSIDKGYNNFSLDWEIGWAHSDDVSSEFMPTFEHVFTDMVRVYIGGDLGNGIKYQRAITGLHLVWPGDLVFTPLLGSDGGYRLTLDKTLYAGDKIEIWMEASYDRFTYWENQIRFTYKFNDNVAVSAAGDSVFGFGVGISLFL